VTAGAVDAGPPAVPAAGWRDRLRPGQLARALGTASPRTVAAVGALGVAIIGVVPMMAASASTTASPIIAEALDGSSAPLNFRAPAFQLTNQDGRQVSLDSLRGKVVLLTFLDPVCTSDCPLIAQEFRQADQLLGGQRRQVELVAVVANPVYNGLSYTQAFDRQEQMNKLPNWDYLTGSVAQLKNVWRQYGIAAQILPAGGMIGHSDVAYVIDRSGRTRTELNFDPGPGTTSSQASFASELYSAAQQNLGVS
jgi:cytochrome oxidase Cu insertion factor (SCO1/SenC/PrrC family)